MEQRYGVKRKLKKHNAPAKNHTHLNKYSEKELQARELVRLFTFSDTFGMTRLILERSIPANLPRPWNRAGRVVERY